MNELSIISKKPIGYSTSTELNVYESFTSKNGFNYIVGGRDNNNILIVEQIAEGVARSFLCGIKIYQKSTNQLIKEINVPYGESYTREKAMVLVRDALLEVLFESFELNKIVVDKDNVLSMVHSVMDTMYFGNSRKAALELAKSLGLIKQ